MDKTPEEYKLMEEGSGAWHCELWPRFYYRVLEGGQPNAFHRFTQRILLGWKWERVDE